MAALSMQFLGVAEISLDGVPVQLERRNSLALLADAGHLPVRHLRGGAGLQAACQEAPRLAQRWA